MSGTFHKTLLISTVLSLGAMFPLAGRAAAQTAGANTDSGDQLQEIVVRARRVEEKLQAVPISVTVLNQQQLNDRNISDPVSLALQTPSLSVNTQFGFDNPSFAIRGFQSDIGTAPTVGVLFGEVVAPRGGVSGSQTHAGDGGGPGSFFDLQDVEVLKGPQGTLFGRNTTGGDIVLTPNRPTDEFEGYLQIGGGDYNQEQLQAVLNLPINDKIRMRFGVDQQHRDGYMHNISGIGPSDFNDINYVAGRVSLIVDITDDIENYTIGSFVQSDPNGQLEKEYACNPNANVSLPLGETLPFGTMACNQLAKDNAAGKYAVDNSLPNARNYLRQWQLINTTSWDINDNLSLKNIASYYQMENEVTTSLFGDNWIFPNGATPSNQYAGQHYYFVTQDSFPGTLGNSQQGWSDEIQVHDLSFNDKLNWQAGLYMEGSVPMEPAGTVAPNEVICTNVYTNNCVDPLAENLIFPPGTLGPGSPGINIPITIGQVHSTYGGITYRSYAAYAQGTYAILDNLKVTAGIRWTDDITSGSFNRLQTQFPAPGGLLPSPTFTSCIISIVQLPDCRLSLHTSSRAPTAVVSVDWSPIEDVLLYAKYARGYREGGLVSTGPADNVLGTQFLTYNPETVDNYEIGAKNTFRGQVSGTFDVAAFMNQFTNQQVQEGFNSNTLTTNPAGPGAATASPVNAGAGRLYGFEVESTIHPLKGVILGIDYTYLNSKITQLTALVLTPAQAAASQFSPLLNAQLGSEFNYAPHNKLSLTGTYQLPVDPEYGKISVGIVYTYTGAQAISPTIQVGGYLQQYDIVDLHANWEGIWGRPVDAEAFITNLFNTYYQTYNFGGAFAGTGYASALYGAPRMFGGRVRFHFGGGSSEPAPAAFTPPPVQAPAPAPHSYLVFFDFDKSDLTPQATQIVDEAAKNAGPAHVTRITCTGHTDTVGSAAYNMRLSKRRAESVASELEKEGIPSSEIDIVAKGKADPLVPTGDGVREPQNRRVQIVYDGGPTS